MNDYSQPNFYRFNQDSLKLVDWIVSKNPESQSVLDLGAGSGVLGIETANRTKTEVLDFVEITPDYISHLKENILNQLRPGIKTNIYLSSFGEWKPTREYDLIVCNPPYYLPSHGVLAKDLRRAIARSFIHDNWDVLLTLVASSLKPFGRAFIVLKNEEPILNAFRASLKDLSSQMTEIDGVAMIELMRLNKN